jgi:hypothetical protein
VAFLGLISAAGRGLALGAALALAACASTPDVKTDFDAAADFSRYHSYSWVYTGTPQGMNPLMFERVRASIDRSLGARFSQGQPGDFAIAFTLGRRDRVEVTDFGSYGPYYRRWGWGPGYQNVDVRNVTDGKLVIDIYDVATRKPVWHGVATQEINSTKVDPAMIDAAVDSVLAKFPPAPAAN